MTDPKDPANLYVERMRSDQADYSKTGDRNPCQMIPWLLMTTGVNLTTKTATGEHVRMNIKDVKDMIERGYYVWSEGMLRTEAVGATRAISFDVSVTRNPEAYQPVYHQEALSQDQMALYGNLSWRKAPCVPHASPTLKRKSVKKEAAE